MWITIYCDASWKDGNAAGSCWIKSNARRHITSFAFYCHDSNMAELTTASLSIHEALKVHEFDTITGILLVCDNSLVIGALKYGAKPLKKLEYKDIQERMKKTLEEANIKIRVKHQKGHSGNKTTGSYINNQVDKMAGETRRKTKYRNS